MDIDIIVLLICYVLWGVAFFTFLNLVLGRKDCSSSECFSSFISSLVPYLTHAWFLETLGFSVLVFLETIFYCVVAAVLFRAYMDRRQNSKQRILPDVGYGKFFSTLALIILTGAVALLPFWLLLIARQGNAVEGQEILAKFSLVRPHLRLYEILGFFGLQLILLSIWWRFVWDFLVPELFAPKQLPEPYHNPQLN